MTTQKIAQGSMMVALIIVMTFFTKLIGLGYYVDSIIIPLIFYMYGRKTNDRFILWMLPALLTVGFIFYQLWAVYLISYSIIGFVLLNRPVKKRISILNIVIFTSVYFVGYHGIYLLYTVILLGYTWSELIEVAGLNSFEFFMLFLLLEALFSAYVYEVGRKIIERKWISKW